MSSEKTLQSIFLMKQLKKLIEENKITLVTLKFNNGELEAIPYFEEMKILPKKDFDELIKSITE